jgi:hypothetical protein
VARAAPVATIILRREKIDPVIALLILGLFPTADNDFFDPEQGRTSASRECDGL